MPPNPIPDYEHRLDRYAIHTVDPPRLDAILAGGWKFHPDGTVKPYYGFTCIAWVDQASTLYATLCKLQQTLKMKFDATGAGHVFSFLRPDSLHMTICDIEASPTPLTHDLDTRLQQGQTAFEAIGAAGSVTAQIRGIGLHSTITALVRFADAAELRKVLAMEQHIKDATQMDVRQFTGHISLAYMVQPPGDHFAAIKDILLAHDTALGDFTFSAFDLTYFPHMNEYNPLLTLDLATGQITRHEDTITTLKAASS
ncbi:MAG: DUF1868 domain-containing protein [Anaerolineae bacterium]|nr:DUF1868 domain-containing protein [Anaerolineae bacterium]